MMSGIEKEIREFMADMEAREEAIRLAKAKFSGETVPLYENARSRYALARAEAYKAIATLRLKD